MVRSDIKLYTWKDAERKIRSYFKDTKVSFINRIDVYSDEIVVEINDSKNEDSVAQIMYEIFGDNFSDIEKKVVYDEYEGELSVFIEVEEKDERKKVLTPLFNDVIYKASSYEKELLDDVLPGCQVIAFHSYKGGVGRTLSMLAFAKAWSASAPEEKVLIIDSDIEAPGITWLLQEEIENDICYLDLLEILQSSQKSLENIVDEIAGTVKQSTVSIDTGKVIVEHYVLPTYRYVDQILDVYSTPDSIVKGYNKRFILAEFLSLLGARVGASAVFVDLRAGISEFSAPLLFDPRVKKYIVTSTSHQSVVGTKLLLEQICKGLPVSEETIMPEILLTMTQDGIDTSEIQSELVKPFETDKSEAATVDTFITELPFASELIHLTTFQQIMKKLDEREFYTRIALLVSDYYLHEKTKQNLKREEVISAIHNLAEKQINAEGNSEFNVLMTNPINNLMRKYMSSVPQAVILGAKGSGKTFLFREMARRQTWQSFNSLGGGGQETETVFVPFISSRNGGDFTDILKPLMRKFNDSISCANASETYWYDVYEEVLAYKKTEQDLIGWKEFWRNCIRNAFMEGADLKTVDCELKEEKRQVVFLVDGLEEIFQKTLEDNNERYAIQAITQELVTEFKTKYKNIGMIVFLRKDLASNVITVNYEQFEAQYRSFALNWSHDEALRLALWLVVQAVPQFYEEEVEVSQVSQEVVEKYLIRLWGLKLGKNNSNEAYASRWILAALSDFNAQLQARDIIRFLQNATKQSGEQIYEDRYIMPAEIRKAVEGCSNAKIDEIETEIAALKPIFEKLKKVPKSKKVLPFTSDEFDLSPQQEKLLKQEGFLKIDNEKYYLPEIIRHALGFIYKKGARPKVLSLLFQKK